MDIDASFIVQSLEKLGFNVSYDASNYEYTVTIPTYRATKDINIVEDIVEEVIRSFGFENIKTQMPSRLMDPFNMQEILNIRKIKEHLAYGMQMHELREYMMYDASWVSKLSVDLTSAVSVKSPLSENWTTLVTSLIPHLFKAVTANAVDHNQLRFFEFNRVWSKNSQNFNEEKILAGIMYDKKSIDFYTAKSELATLFDALGIKVVYKKSENVLPAWYDSYQSSEIHFEDKAIGRLGIVSYAWMHKIVDGQAFIFEIEGEFLENLKPIVKKFKPWSKYQDVLYDISLLVPFTVTSDMLCDAIKKAHANIIDVKVVDFFEKPEWQNHRSITVRYTISDTQKTMTKSDLDLVVASVVDALKGYNVEIR